MTELKLKPRGEYVLLQSVEEETTLPSGIVIPDTAKEKPQKGLVVAVGTGKLDDDGKRIPLELKGGEVVLYKKWGGTEVKIAGKEYLLVKEEDILAVFTS